MGELIISATIGGVIILAALVGILALDKDIENIEQNTDSCLNSKKEETTNGK